MGRNQNRSSRPSWLLIVIRTCRRRLIDAEIASPRRRQRNADVANRLALSPLIIDQLPDARDIGVDRVLIVRVDAVAKIDNGARGDGCGANLTGRHRKLRQAERRCEPKRSHLSDPSSSMIPRDGTLAVLEYRPQQCRAAEAALPGCVSACRLARPMYSRLSVTVPVRVTPLANLPLRVHSSGIRAPNVCAKYGESKPSFFMPS